MLDTVAKYNGLDFLSTGLNSVLYLQDRHDGQLQSAKLSIKQTPAQLDGSKDGIERLATNQ